MSMSGFSPFGGSKPIKLLKDHEQFFIEKPPFPSNLDDDPNIKDKMDKVFIHFAKKSGLYEREDYIRRIDLKGTALDKQIREELIALFRPKETDGFLTYAEFVNGIRNMASTFVRKNKQLQSHANSFLQSVIREAEQKAGFSPNRNNNNYIDSRDQERGHHDKGVDDSIGPETDHIEDNDSGRLKLFRSASITIEDFDDVQKSFFIPDNNTNHMLNTCFPELFTEGGGVESIPKGECQREILKKYGQLFDYFGEQSREGQVIRRSTMAQRFMYLAENWIKSDPGSNSLCVTYIQQKLERVTRVCENLADTPVFREGDKVLYKATGYDEEMPAVITGVVRIPHNIDTTYKITLDNSPIYEEMEVYVYCLRHRTPEDDERLTGTYDVISGTPTIKVTPAFDMNPQIYEMDSLDILRAIEVYYGPNFEIHAGQGGGIPSNQGEKFNFWYNIEGKRVDFDFIQYDYGVKFIQADSQNNFLPLEAIDTEKFDHNRLEKSACVQETNRCFFLHLGVGIGLHPIAFEIAYRKQATQLLNRIDDDDLNVLASQSVLDRDEFVDCMALASLWPREFDEFQILIVNLDRDGTFNAHQGFTHIRAPTSQFVDPRTGDWKGRDIVLTLQSGHFTFLVPTGDNIRDRPVNTMLDYARKGNFTIATPMELFTPSFEEVDRVSLINLLREFLSGSGGSFRK